MLKQIISFLIIIALSAAVAFLMPEAQKLIQLLVSSHDWVSGVLTNVFNGGHAGNIAREGVALLIIPLLAGLIPAMIFFLVRKHWLPCFMEIVWVIWLLQAGALLINYVYPANADAQSDTTISQPADDGTQAPAPAPAAPDTAPATPAASQ